MRWACVSCTVNNYRLWQSQEISPLFCSNSPPSLPQPIQNFAIKRDELQQYDGTWSRKLKLSALITSPCQPTVSPCSLCHYVHSNSGSHFAQTITPIFACSTQMNHKPNPCESVPAEIHPEVGELISYSRLLLERLIFAQLVQKL